MRLLESDYGLKFAMNQKEKQMTRQWDKDLIDKIANRILMYPDSKVGLEMLASDLGIADQVYDKLEEAHIQYRYRHMNHMPDAQDYAFE